MKIENVKIPSFLESLSFYQENIERSVDRFVNDLIELTDQRKVSENLGVVITKRDSDSYALADIKSVVGCARLVQGWRLDDSSQLEAVITVERQRRDKYDVIFWEPIMYVYAPHEAACYFNGEKQRVIVSNHWQEANVSLYYFLQMILVGIVNGPLYCN